MQNNSFLFIVLLAIVIIYQQNFIQCQVLDRIFSSRSGSLDDITSNGEIRGSEMRPIFKRLMNALNVNVPGIYDMTKDGSSMGINVLSGLVRVDRGKEAERSGLIGPRPLSVRVFGVPVYERGVRIGGQPSNDDNPEVIFSNDKDNTPRSEEDEELPIES